MAILGNVRVGVKHPDGSISAYGVGTIQDHVDLVTGNTVTKEEMVTALKVRAEADYPENKGFKVQVEELQDNGDGTGKWVVKGP